MLSFETAPSEGVHAFGQGDVNDLSTRLQAFASDGDAIFQPRAEAQPVRQYESPFISPPAAPQTNPFVSMAQQQQQQSQEQIRTSTKPTNLQEPQSTNFNVLLGSQTPRLPLLRTGHNGSASNNDLRHSSPELSIESSIMTNQSLNGASNTTLPIIPDIRKDQNQRGTFASVQAQNGSNYSLTINFTPQLSMVKLATNPKGRLDIDLKIVMHVRSARNGSMDSESSQIVNKWYSELKSMHERLSLSTHNINFPPLSGYTNVQESVTENDILNLQKYLGTLTDCILNVDHNTPVAHEFLSFLDNQSNSLQDKIRMMILEARMTSTVNCCDRLQNRLQNAEKSLTESSNLIAFLRYRVEQLENVNSVPRHGNENLHQGEHRRSQTVNGYATQQNQTAASFNNSADPMFVSNIRIDNGIKNNFAPPENNVNPSQLVTLAEEVLNEKGPLPVGEVGKMLQEATGNPQLSQVLKERHNGLKKFLEKYADKFIMSCDHPFNPHVYLRRSYSPDDQRLIESGSTIFINDKKPKKPRRKEKKAWPVGVAPAIGPYQSRIYP